MERLETGQKRLPGKVRSNSLLLLTAVIWGSAFVAQSVGLDYVGPFTFGASRMFLGGLVLIPLILFLDRMNAGKIGKEENRRKKAAERKTLFAGGILCGVVLFAASSVQQIGIAYTTVGKAGFITSLYIVLVPLFGIFVGKKVSGKIWGSVILALAGLYLLCMTGGEGGGFAFGKGDLLILACAAAFSVHILVVDYYSPRVDGVRMSCIQFFVSALLSGCCMLIWEDPQPAGILAAGLPILYAGVLSCGVGYTIQIIAQKGIHPTIASLILSLESVFSVLAGWVILGQKLNLREGAGCALMFLATVLAQLPSRLNRNKKN